MKKLFSYAMPLVAMLCVSLLFSCHSDLKMPDSPDEKYSSSLKKSSSSALKNSLSSETN